MTPNRLARWPPTSPRPTRPISHPSSQRYPPTGADDPGKALSVHVPPVFNKRYTVVGGQVQRVLNLQDARPGSFVRIILSLFRTT